MLGSLIAALIITSLTSPLGVAAVARTVRLREPWRWLLYLPTAATAYGMMTLPLTWFLSDYLWWLPRMITASASAGAIFPIVIILAPRGAVIIGGALYAAAMLGSLWTVVVVIRGDAGGTEAAVAITWIVFGTPSFLAGLAVQRDLENKLSTVDNSS